MAKRPVYNFLQKLSKNHLEIIVAIIGGLRFTVPFYIFISPVWTLIVSTVLDAIDGYFIFRLGWRWKHYHLWDKVFDYWWYVFIMLFFIGKPTFALVVFLLIYRTIGQFITLKRSNSKYLIWYPNIIENYFVAYLLSVNISSLSGMFTGDAHDLVFLVCTVIAVGREYVLHVKKRYAANYIFKMGIDWSKNI